MIDILLSPILNICFCLFASFLNFSIYFLGQTANDIGDRGLEILAHSCKHLKRLRIESGIDEVDDEGGLVTQRGLTALAEGCLELEHLAVYMSDITNAALESIGTHSKNLFDFRLVLYAGEAVYTDLPLDNGVRALLMGCQKLRRFALSLRPGGLTDVGLGYIGQYSQNIRWMLLECVGQSDAGLIQLAKGCPSLQKLEIGDCSFSGHAIAAAVMHLTSLRYFWVKGYRGSDSGQELLAMARPFWNIELIPAQRLRIKDQLGGINMSREYPAYVFAYYSLAGPRTDFPNTVVLVRPANLHAAAP